MRATCLKVIALCAMLFPMYARAQDKFNPDKPAAAEPEHFKLSFRLMQANADGKIVNSRNYSMIVAAAGPQRAQSIRTGDRLPAMGNYIDVGTNIDTNDEHVLDHALSLRVDVESSSALKSENPATALPLVRHTTWGSQVVVPLDKPTIIFTADNVSDTGKTELELTATEVGHH